ncbi:MAG: hypothetical protein K8R23_15055 [Chthoniobacter sp.]|nr:hypothetical protein [Chthoniobacter sp.]
MSIEEILGTIQDGSIQVCATADANYDPSAESVTVTLGAFSRRAPATADGEHLPQPWLPPGEKVSEHLSRGEADEFVKDVFQSWVKKVRAAIPATTALRT